MLKCALQVLSIIIIKRLPLCGDIVLGSSLDTCKLSSNCDWEIDFKEGFRWSYFSLSDAVKELTFATKTYIAHLFRV